MILKENKSLIYKHFIRFDMNWWILKSYIMIFVSGMFRFINHKTFFLTILLGVFVFGAWSADAFKVQSAGVQQYQMQQPHHPNQNHHHQQQQHHHPNQNHHHQQLQNHPNKHIPFNSGLQNPSKTNKNLPLTQSPLQKNPKAPSTNTPKPQKISTPTAPVQNSHSPVTIIGNRINGSRTTKTSNSILSVGIQANTSQGVASKSSSHIAPLIMVSSNASSGTTKSGIANVTSKISIQSATKLAAAPSQNLTKVKNGISASQKIITFQNKTSLPSSLPSSLSSSLPLKSSVSPSVQTISTKIHNNSSKTGSQGNSGTIPLKKISVVNKNPSTIAPAGVQYLSVQKNSSTQLVANTGLKTVINQHKTGNKLISGQNSRTPTVQNTSSQGSKRSNSRTTLLAQNTSSSTKANHHQQRTGLIRIRSSAPSSSSSSQNSHQKSSSSGGFPVVLIIIFGVSVGVGLAFLLYCVIKRKLRSSPPE